MNRRHFAVFILFKACTGHKIGIHQTHLIARKQTKIFLWRLLHEVLAFDVQFPGERHLSRPKRFVFHIILHFKIFGLIFRIIIDHKLDRIQYRHHPRTLQLQILPDAVFQHRVIDGGLTLGNPAQIHEQFDGFRRKAPPSERRNRNKAGIIPAVYDFILDKLFDIPLSRHDIGQIKLRKFDLLWRKLILKLAHHPVI